MSMEEYMAARYDSIEVDKIEMGLQDCLIGDLVPGQEDQDVPLLICSVQRHSMSFGPRIFRWRVRMTKWRRYSW